MGLLDDIYDQVTAERKKVIKEFLDDFNIIKDTLLRHSATLFAADVLGINKTIKKWEKRAKDNG